MWICKVRVAQVYLTGIPESFWSGVGLVDRLIYSKPLMAIPKALGSLVDWKDIAQVPKDSSQKTCDGRSSKETESTYPDFLTTATGGKRADYCCGCC